MFVWFSCALLEGLSKTVSIKLSSALSAAFCAAFLGLSEDIKVAMNLFVIISDQYSDCGYFF